VTSTSKYAGRSTRRYKSLRLSFRRTCAREEAPCWLCGRPINYELPNGHPDSFNVDHAVPVSKRRDLAEDRANFRPSHRDCNIRRGAGVDPIPIGIPSERW
jgi:5-methylcytosine-specific restriction endonuclease McrA